MIQKITSFFIVCLIACGTALAEEHKGVPLYSVSSQDFDNSDSLNRISGDIDLGFGAPSQYSGMLRPSVMPDRSEDY